MNGFANAILTLLLSWMRVLVNDCGAFCPARMQVCSTVFSRPTGK